MKDDIVCAHIQSSNAEVGNPGPEVPAKFLAFVPSELDHKILMKSVAEYSYSER